MSIIDSIQLSGSSYDVRDKSATTVVSLTQQEYDALPSSAKTANILYNITDATAGDLTQYWTSAQTQSAITEAVSGKQDTLVSGTNIKTINNESILGSGNITIQGGGTDTGTVQTMIDQSISGKADSSTVTALTNTVTGHTADTSIHVTTTQTAAWDAKSDFSGSYNDLTDKPTIPIVPTSNTAFTNDAGYITSSALNGYATTGDVQTATSGKVDTSTYTAYTASTDAALATKQTTLTAGTNITIVDNVISAEGGGKAIKGGRGIAITTGETADTVSFNLPISAGTGVNSLIIAGARTATGQKSIAIGTNSAAKGTQSIAINQSTANGQDSFSQGTSYAQKTRSSAFGNQNYSNNNAELSCGQFNNSVSGSSTFGDSGNTLFSVGNGTSNSARHNAFEIRQNGDIYISSGGTDIKLQDHLGGGGGTVESAITSGSTNAVESKAIWSATTYNKEVTLQWDNGFPLKLSINYPSGCKKFVVTVPSNKTATIYLYNGGSPIGGNITIDNWSSPSVSIDGYDGTTYTIDGNDVTFVVPDTITFDNLGCDIRSITSIKAIVEGAWIADNTYMKSEVDAIQNTLQNNINQKLDSTAYTPVNVDSALIENSTNPVEGGVLYDELVYKGAASETTLTFDERQYSTNYPEGCTQIKVEVAGSMNYSTIDFYNDFDRLGNININNYGSISVNNSFEGATYEISGTTVIISYPTVQNVTKIYTYGNGNYVFKAVTYGASTTVKDALGGLKFVKLTQTEYDNLQTKDNNTLYVIVN